MFVNVFVILTGNICRSPIAEAVFRKMATEAGVVDNVINHWLNIRINYIFI